MPDHIPSIAAFSQTVGSIYDCALDPARWPEAIREVCAATTCMGGVIAVSDLVTGATRLQQHWNLGQAWLDRMVLYGPEIAEMLSSVPDLQARPIDEPMVGARDFDPAVLQRSRYYNEWVRPQGVIDVFNLTVLRQRDRIGSFAMSRHESNGVITDRDIEIVRLLAPHIRRAIAISDVLDMRAVTIGTFESSLDLMAAGVVLVDGHARIIHANRAAQSMLAAGAPIRSDRGELRTYLPETTTALKAAIAKAAGNEAAIGSAGVGVPAPQADGAPALIHVLPLANGDVRTRIAPRASAALFITPAPDGFGTPPAALAALFDLSPAETRTLERLIAGDTLAHAADKLGIAVTTVRTHLAHIFEKTGTSRQAELIGLAAKFAPPIGLSSGI
jgi:DNA-binding CsgD family transcriptional regulator/PAS domain-containing protein